MGEIFALTTALIWAMAVILLKKSGERIPPFVLNYFRVAVSGTLFVVTILVGRVQFFGRAPLADYLVLVLSGTIAIAVSDTFFHRCLNVAGAGITAIVDCLYSPFVVLTAFLLIGERVGPWDLVGMGFIIVGVLVAAGHRPPPGTPRRRIVVGVMWGVLAMATLAFGIVIAKPVLERHPVLWATAVRQLGALLVMTPVAFLARRRATIAALRPSRHWVFMIPAAVLGSFLALLFWIAGMKYTQVGSAAILNQTSTIHILVFASLFLGEPFTRRKLAAIILAVAGIVMVTAL
ncbi:MAG: DMT family transporter [Candidatus Krumholzibacteriota bacterium]|nr:DMT family transporter [Candidatus Krumholzibacteriota bacterium]